MPRSRLPYALAFATLLVANGAHAGDVSKAEALFKQGRAALEAGDYARACELLEGSYAEDRAVGVLMNLAFCHQMSGKVWLAYREYTEALKQPLAAERRGFAERGRAQVERKLPHVQLELGGAVVSQVEYEDGTVIDTPDKPFAVEPGRRTITLRAPGAAPRSVSFDAPARAALIAVVVTAAESTAIEKDRPVATTEPASSKMAPPNETPSREPRNARNTWGWITTGLGVAGIGTGAIFGMRSLAIRDDACASKACDAAGLSRIEGGATTTATISTVAFVAGGVALVTGAMLLLTGSTSPSN